MDTPSAQGRADGVSIGGHETTITLYLTRSIEVLGEDKVQIAFERVAENDCVRISVRV